MCDTYIPCNCLFEKLSPEKELTTLLLDCWQREYDNRPYRHFEFKRLDFEERMNRCFHNVKDLEVIIEFLEHRKLCSAKFVGFRLPQYKPKLIERFIESLIPICGLLQFKLMNLPINFFEIFLENVEHLKVSELSFEGTTLGNAEISIIRKFLMKTTKLSKLNVANCGITQFNFVYIADGIYRCDSLRSFNCSHLIGDRITLDSMKMAHILSSIIGQNKLHELIIRHCEFNGHDMETICEYMATPKSILKKFDVSCNVIGGNGANALFKAIASSGTLTHLYLSGNKLGVHGGDEVAKYLSSCYRLEYLDITFNDIPADVISNILTMMKKPIYLSFLAVWGNHFDGRCAMILNRLLASRVVPQKIIDITVTKDDKDSQWEYRIIPYL